MSFEIELPGWSPPGTATPVLTPDLRERVRLIPRYNVLLHDDDDHTFDYVIEMLRVIFGFPAHKGFQHAHTVHTQGHAILMTTTREHAELKQEQVHAYGPDWRSRQCAGSMTCTIEPVD